MKNESSLEKNPKQGKADKNLVLKNRFLGF